VPQEMSVCVDHDHDTPLDLVSMYNSMANPIFINNSRTSSIIQVSSKSGFREINNLLTLNI
jgi:hypothetical protein